MLECALHLDEPGDLEDGIDVRVLHETLRHADVHAVDDGLRRTVGNNAGVGVAGEVRPRLELVQAERADELFILAQRAVGAGRRRAALRIEQDRRPARVENRVAFERHQFAGLQHAESSVAGHHRPDRSLDCEPGIALDDEVERIAGFAQRPRFAGKKCLAGRGEGNRLLAESADHILELDSGRPEADRARIGDVVGNGRQATLERDL